MNINQEIKNPCFPASPDLTEMTFRIYYTQEYEAKYCDEPGMKFLGMFTIDLPGSGRDREVLFSVAFGKMEITASAKNKLTGQSYITTFKFNFDD